MLKKISVISLLLLIFSCTTVELKEPLNNTIDSIVTDEIVITPVEEPLLRQALSDNVLAKADPYFADYAVFILDLIRNKKWDSFSEMTNLTFYNSYVLDNNGSLIDYSMFMLHTGDEGISTSYSLNEIESAFYTDSYVIDDMTCFEGIYLYPTGETEFFKIIIQDSPTGLIITRE